MRVNDIPGYVVGFLMHIVTMLLVVECDCECDCGCEIDRGVWCTP